MNNRLLQTIVPLTLLTGCPQDPPKADPSDFGVPCTIGADSGCPSETVCLQNTATNKLTCLPACNNLGENCGTEDEISICLPVQNRDENRDDGVCLFPPIGPILEAGAECGGEEGTNCVANTVCASTVSRIGNQFACLSICSICQDGVRQTLDCPEGQTCTDYTILGDTRIGLCLDSDRVATRGEDCVTSIEQDFFTQCVVGTQCQGNGPSRPVCVPDPLPTCEQ